MSHNNKKIKIIFTCLDWRLHPQIEEYFARDGVAGDMCVTAGSIKDLINPQTRPLFLKQIEISKNLHHCQTAVLTMHLDCGAYGGSAAFADLANEIAAAKNELRSAKSIVAKNFPELAIETYIIGLEKINNGWKIKPEAVSV